MSGVSQTARPSASVYPLSRSVRSGIQRPIGFKASCIFLPLGRDHDNLTAGGVEFPLRLDKRIDAHSTVWTPMPAMEHDGRWAIRNQGFQMEQPAALIRQDKRRHPLARSGRPAAAILLYPFDEPVDSLAVGGKNLSARGRHRRSDACQAYHPSQYTSEMRCEDALPSVPMQRPSRC